MKRITAQDIVLSERLIAAVFSRDVRATAKVIADIREVDVSCATARVGRVYAVRERKAAQRAVAHGGRDG